MFFVFFSQSYDIGKMDVKYAPEAEVQVRQCSSNFETCKGFILKK